MNEENKQLNPVEEKVRLLTLRVGMASGALAIFLLLVGVVGWKVLWFGIPCGIAIGFGSFFILAQTIKTLTAPSKIQALAMVIISSLKLLLLLLLLWLLYRLGFDMLQLVAGLFLSQLAIFSGIVLTFHRGRSSSDQIVPEGEQK